MMDDWPLENFMQRRRRWGGRGGTCPPQVLGYQLTLFGPRGQIMPAILLLGPLIFLNDAASLLCHKLWLLFKSGLWWTCAHAYCSLNAQIEVQVLKRLFALCFAIHLLHALLLQLFSVCLHSTLKHAFLLRDHPYITSAYFWTSLTHPPT